MEVLRLRPYHRRAIWRQQRQLIMRSNMNTNQMDTRIHNSSQINRHLGQIAASGDSKLQLSGY